jgi:hypothetical protein
MIRVEDFVLHSLTTYHQEVSMDSYAVMTYNGGSQSVAYPEGDYPSQESAQSAAKALRDMYPLGSNAVQNGWYTGIEVVASDGAAYGPPLYRY